MKNNLIFSWLDWNPDLGITDIISTIATGLTLLAVYISSKAAKSAEISSKFAKEATKHTEEQTKLLKEQYEYSLSPKLLPNSMTIDKDHISVTKFGGSSIYGDIALNIKNVGKGNAYYIRAWIEIDDLDFFIEENKLISYSYSLFSTYSYKMKFLQEEHNGTRKLEVVEQTTENGDITSFSAKLFDILHIKVPWVALNSNETHDFPVYAYIQALLMNSLFQEKSAKDEFKFSLYISYQTEHQLGTEEETTTKFDVMFSSGKISIGSNRERALLTIFFLPEKIK